MSVWGIVGGKTTAIQRIEFVPIDVASDTLDFEQKYLEVRRWVRN